MNTKTKTTIITALLLLAMVSGAVAQEKWDLAIVFYDGVKPVIHVIKNNEPHKEIETGSKEYYEKTRKLLSVVSDLTANGWEIINVIANDTYYLKKKTQ